MNDDVENLKKQFQAQSDKLSEEEKATRAKQIEVKQKSFQRNYEDFQNEAQQAEGEVLNRIGQKMMAVLDKYAKANGYAAVLDVSSTQTVLWANQGNVITKELVSAYNAEYPAGGPPAAKPAGATAPKTPRKRAQAGRYHDTEKAVIVSRFLNGRPQGRPFYFHDSIYFF